MVERKGYLQQLLSWKDEQVIKVVTGIRRCGKSTLLQQYQKLLRGQGSVIVRSSPSTLRTWNTNRCWITQLSTASSRNGCSRTG